MAEEFSELPVEQLESYLLSKDVLWKLQFAIGDAAKDFGLGKEGHEIELARAASKFPNLNTDFFFETRGNMEGFNYDLRTHSHLERLLDPKRSKPENYFGLLFAHYGIEAGKRQYPAVASKETPSTPFFWSIAPYLAQELHYYGVPPRQIAETVFAWGNTAGSRGQKQLLGMDKFYGLDAFYSMELILSEDPDNLTHKFSSGVAQLLCRKHDMFKDAIKEANPMAVRDTNREYQFTED